MHYVIMGLISLIASITRFPKLIELYKSSSLHKKRIAKNRAIEILQNEIFSYHWNPDVSYITITLKQSENPKLIKHILQNSKWVQPKSSGNLIWTISSKTNPEADVDIRVPLSENCEKLRSEFFQAQSQMLDKLKIQKIEKKDLENRMEEFKKKFTKKKIKV